MALRWGARIRDESGQLIKRSPGQIQRGVDPVNGLKGAANIESSSSSYCFDNRIGSGGSIIRLTDVGNTHVI